MVVYNPFIHTLYYLVTFVNYLYLPWCLRAPADWLRRGGPEGMGAAVVAAPLPPGPPLIMAAAAAGETEEEVVSRTC